MPQKWQYFEVPFGRQAEKIGRTASEEGVYELMQLTLKHLQLTLNLAGPKIAKTSKQQELETEAKIMMNALTKAIDEIAPIPF
ncbi:hypothetical protein [Cyanobium sp. ULC082]